MKQTEIYRDNYFRVIDMTFYYVVQTRSKISKDLYFYSFTEAFDYIGVIAPINDIFVYN